MQTLKVSSNQRFLTTADGKPFFYLADTAWELFHRLSLSEAEHYLATRAKQGFTAIQAVALAELDGLSIPNPSGHKPLQDNDSSRPNEAYFKDVDAIIQMANQKGLYVSLLPTWGDKVNKMWGGGPEIFTPANARTYGEFLGRRYKEAGIIWVLGGDRPATTDLHMKIWRAMAEGLRVGDGGRHLMTYHPMGGRSSSEVLHNEPWLDFNMMQSGHSNRVTQNYKMVEKDYRLTPTKPCIDAEPCYEDHPVDWKPDQLGWFDEYEVRRGAYWAVFSGACGHTYGCHDVWQMWQPGREPIAWARTPWKQALDLPGSKQMRHLKELMLSRPYLTRIPDQALILGDNQDGERHIVATRDEANSYAFFYTPVEQSITAKLSGFQGERVHARWMDPRNGITTAPELLPRTNQVTLTPPKGGKDWVLVLNELVE